MVEQNKVEWSQASFRAFISYSHSDARLVRRLHSQLETYRLPKGLGEIASQNSHPRDLGRIFRDREYLAVAQDLSTTVKSALERTEVLVVVCSPQAKASQWVEREIEYFRSFYPDRPILAALVEGEPADAFPPALLEDGVEPLAADLRKEGDGWKLGFLKLVAGIVDVPLDALIQRDSQRKTTRVMAVTGAVGVFALCMMAMAVVAFQARNEAQFQQAEAENVVGYLVGELRTELKGVGRLDVMRRANERALAYYKAQEDLKGLSPESLSQRATVLHAIGEDELHLEGGDRTKAGEILAEAFRGTEAGLSADPENPDRIFEHAQSNYWVGYHAYAADDLDRTQAMWSSYRDLTARLYQADSSKAEWVSEAAYGEGNLCTLEVLRDGDMKSAQTQCRSALDLFLEASSLKPEDPKHLVDIANRYAWLAETHAGLGELTEERTARLEGEKHAEMLLERDPENRDWQDLWLASQIALAEDEIDVGDTRAADKRLARAQSVAEELVQRDPENAAWKLKLEMIAKLRG
ncbi:toll/interleukin-1 receptor domain-containing protein [uncultured Erythrobacter sp.]|uniref:toll/interleukin-1 receptor domain-containing protein n=1 Tax=uncultured Erythrobacter sp. TaxID=263913 RepID=UPI002634185D|nr:toll/interleukin-1 receptor domain-containing protein [uncultured Erythrobacter sp.]